VAEVNIDRSNRNRDKGSGNNKEYYYEMNFFNFCLIVNDCVESIIGSEFHSLGKQRK